MKKIKKKLFIVTFGIALLLGISACSFGGSGNKSGSKDVESITISGPDTIETNKSIAFSATINPSNAKHDGVVWAILGDNTIGATISSTGNFLATSPGTIKISAAAGGKSAEKTITVNPITVTVTLNPNGGSGITKLTLIGKAGEPMELPVPIRAGYEFDAWYKNWDIVDNTIFPQSSMTLTARYYVIDDIQKSITSKPTEINKVYQYGAAFTVAGGAIHWDRSWFEDTDTIDYLIKNHTTQITVGINFEYRVTGDTTFKLTGASNADILQSKRLSSSSTYQNMTLSSSAQARILIGSNKYVALVFDAHIGSSYIYVRNPLVSISYTEKAGTMV